MAINGFLVLAAVLLVVVLAFIARGVRIVPQGSEWTVERFGRYRVTLAPGLHLINPFIDTIGRRINVQETVLDIPAQSVITKDNASVQALSFTRCSIPAGRRTRCRICSER
jgi:regulator of protease activity HflC (stomatin/prohibitin superfamily)